MSLSLPGIDLFYLPKDNLTPEEYERIISPFAAWSHIERRYEFDDGWNGSHYLIRMREKNFYRSPNQPPPHGPREKARMKNMVEHGEVVMLNPFSGPAGLFYINDNGNLICTHSGAFAFSGADRVIREYQRSVDQRDYRRRDGKPRPTRKQAFTGTSGQNINPETAGKTINSKAAGRLLAAGGIYNGNIAGFRQLAEQLGGEAPSGYEQVMNDQTKGLLIAGASIAAGLGLGRLSTSNEISELKNLHVLGKVEGEYSMIKPGPLPKDLAETFSSGVYKEITLSTDTTFYRAGIASRPLGQFFGYEQPLGQLQTRVDKALLPEWPDGSTSPLDSYHEIQIPAGTKVYFGEVGYQTNLYSGGTEQVVIPISWKIPGVKILDSGGLK